MPNNTLFDIKTGINQIKEMLEDKVRMKSIKVDVKHDSFFNDYTVKTDMKRMQ